MASLPTDTILIDPDLMTWITEVHNQISAPVVTTDAATYSVLSANTGKLHVIPDLTADCTFSMPAEAAGLHYKFIYGGAAADAQDWLFDTGSNTNYYVGGGVHLFLSSQMVTVTRNLLFSPLRLVLVLSSGAMARSGMLMLLLCLLRLRLWPLLTSNN
jgi:hypothetical protein